MNALFIPARARVVAATALAAVAATLAGCAITSSGDVAPPPSLVRDCTQLQSAIRTAEDDRRIALERQEDAWKAVVPFAVVARYGSGKSAFADADARLKGLRAEAAAQGCTGHAR